MKEEQMRDDDARDEATDNNWSPEQSAYEGRPDDPRADVDAGRRGRAAGIGAGGGSGAEQNRQGDSEVEREGGGASKERD
jgi:hypothetical protein